MISKDNIRIKTTISRQENDELRELAKERGVSVSQLIAALISFELGMRLGGHLGDKLKDKPPV